MLRSNDVDKLFRQHHDRRPLFWTILAFVIVVATATALSVSWQVLLIQNHRILETIRAAASDPSRAQFPMAVLVLIGILCTLVILLGLVYMFLRLIKAVQLNLAQSQFISAVTHELRSPVASMRIMLDTIRNPQTSSEKRQEFENCMDSDLRRLGELVDQVLETARLENLFRRAVCEPIPLKNLIDNCLRHHDTRLRTAQANVHLSPFDTKLRVLANRKLLQTAVSNILDNALKYCATNKPEIFIKVQATSRGVALEIKDNGIGLESADQKKIFKRFFRAKNAAAHNRTGTGLGLYFARLAICSQGGKISVFSEGIGYGSTFRIEILTP